MKLAALYTLFNGVDQLGRSLEEIRESVDEIIFGLQTVSNSGNTINYKDADIISAEAKKYGILSNMVRYDPDLSLNPKENERRKFGALIRAAKVRGCTHFVLLAADHIYQKDEFNKAKEYIKEHDMIDVSLSSMYTYYKKPTWQLTPIENYYMPFICKIHPNTTVSALPYPYLTDPSVRVRPIELIHRFREKDLMLHHYSMVRKDIRSKFENAAAAQNWPQKIEGFIDEFNNYDIEENHGVSYFKGRKIKEVNNLFNLVI